MELAIPFLCWSVYSGTAIYMGKLRIRPNSCGKGEGRSSPPWNQQIEVREPGIKG